MAGRFLAGVQGKVTMRNYRGSGHGEGDPNWQLRRLKEGWNRIAMTRQLARGCRGQMVLVGTVSRLHAANVCVQIAQASCSARWRNEHQCAAHLHSWLVEQPTMR